MYKRLTAQLFNDVVGELPITSPYTSTTAPNKINALLGVGYGDRGYGQVSPAVEPAVQYSTARQEDITNIEAAVTLIRDLQGSSVVIPPSTDLEGLVTILQTLDTNRLSIPVTKMATTSSSLTITRGTTWGTSTSGISCTASITFPSEDAARYFFNTGGMLDLRLAHPYTNTPQNQNWNTILSGLGVISMSARNTTRSGTRGTPLARGYYDLTSAWQDIFNGTNIGTGAYSANDVMISARVTNATGTNGGNGRTIEIRATLTDQHTNSWSDTVRNGTNAVFGFKKAVVDVTGIASPTFTTISNF